MDSSYNPGQYIAFDIALICFQKRLNATGCDLTIKGKELYLKVL